MYHIDWLSKLYFMCIFYSIGSPEHQNSILLKEITQQIAVSCILNALCLLFLEQLPPPKKELLQ